MKVPGSPTTRRRGGAAATPKVDAAFEYLAAREEAAESFSVEELAAASGWALSSTRTYVSKRLQPFLDSAPGKRYRVRGVRRLGLQGFRGHFSQTRSPEARVNMPAPWLAEPASRAVGGALRAIEIRGYRCLRDVTATLGGFQVVVGPNGSGKSSFFDALALLRDVLDVGVEAAIMGSLKAGIPQRVANPADITWMSQCGDLEIAVTVELPPDVIAALHGSARFARYELTVAVEPVFHVPRETLWLCDTAKELPPPGAATAGWRKIVSRSGSGGNAYFTGETSKWRSPFRLGTGKTALANLPDDQVRFPAATWLKRFLRDGVQVLSLDAAGMRKPCPTGSPATFLMDGTNLPWLALDLATREPKRFQAWVRHVAGAIPGLVDVHTPERLEDRARYLELRFANGLRTPSWSVSDGTLRLLALTLLAYSRRTPALLLVEEPENGIHPQAIETVFHSLSSVYGSQVLCATHSSVVVGLSRVEQLMCFGRGPDGGTTIVPGASHQRLREWKGALDLGSLFAAGVLS